MAGPDADPPAEITADSWTLAMTRELDDLILDLRTNEPELGTWVLRTTGDPARVLAHDADLLERGDWAADEVVHFLKRTLKRLDVTSRSLVALAEPGSCFAGSLLELALAADRSFQLAGVFEDPSDGRDPDGTPATLHIGPMNLGPLPMGNDLTPAGHPVLGRPGRAAQGRGGRRPGAAGRGGRGAGPGHLRPRTTSTGTRRSGSRWRSGPASAPTR